MNYVFLIIGRLKKRMDMNQYMGESLKLHDNSYKNMRKKEPTTVDPWTTWGLEVPAPPPQLEICILLDSPKT